MAQSESNLLRASLDLLILKSLCWGPRHGYAVSEWIHSATDGSLLVEEGTLYPALHRLERKRWISSDWGRSENNRRARFYTLTPAGRGRLVAETDSWQRFVSVVEKALTIPVVEPA